MWNLPILLTTNFKLNMYSTFMDTMTFTHKYPWTANEKAPALWNHIQTLKNLYQKSPKIVH